MDLKTLMTPPIVLRLIHTSSIWCFGMWQTVALTHRDRKIPISALTHSTTESADRWSKCLWTFIPILNKLYSIRVSAVLLPVALYQLVIYHSFCLISRGYVAVSFGAIAFCFRESRPQRSRHSRSLLRLFFQIFKFIAISFYPRTLMSGNENSV